MLRQIDNPLVILRGLLESLLILYRYDVAERAVCVVFDYPHKAPQASRAFLRVRFTGVSNFRRIPGLVAELQEFTETFSSRNTKAVSVLQNVDIKAEESAVEVRLGFGRSFGGISFTCTAATADVRNAHATRIDNDEWTYCDLDDGKRLDFYDPFSERRE